MNKQLRTVARITAATIGIILAIILAVEDKYNEPTMQSEAVSGERAVAQTQIPTTPTQMPALKQEPVPTATNIPTPIADDFTVITGDVGIPQVTEAITQAIEKAVEKKSTPTPEPTEESAKIADAEDVELLAEVIYHENWHTDEEKKTAYWTGAVVLNRVKSDHWPNTIREVLYQKNPTQYSTTHKFFTVELPEECYEMARNILENGTPDVPENVVYQSRFKQGSGVWQELNGEYFCYE